MKFQKTHSSVWKAFVIGKLPLAENVVFCTTDTSVSSTNLKSQHTVMASKSILGIYEFMKSLYE